MTAGPDEPKKRKGRKSKKDERKKGKPDRKARKAGSKKASGKSKRSAGQHRADLIRAIDHPLRRRVLRILTEEGEPLSPAEIKRRLDMPLGAVSYQVRVLRNLNAVKLARSRQVRGALEHFYISLIGNDPPIQMLLNETREFDEEEA